MSFTNEIKQELSYNELLDCCNKAELSALLQMTSSLSISNRKLNLLIRSENPTTAKRELALLKKLYKAKTELIVAKKTNLKKNNVYTLDVEDGKSILIDTGLYSETRGLLSHPTYSIVLKNCCARAYLAGCFIACGSCNAPSNKNYHLEISTNDLDHANFIVKLFGRFDMSPKISKRRNRYIVYLKKADMISDFLRLVGANESLMNFENTRISRDLKNSLIRIDNCEIANEIKTIKAAEQQVEYMQRIVDAGKYNDLDEKLRNIIDLRLQFQDYSLLELCEAYDKRFGSSLSKSGLKHRLNKIENYARSLQ